MKAILFSVACISMVSMAMSAEERQAVFELKVVDEDGQPVANADVLLILQASTHRLDRTMNLKTGPDGSLKATGWSNDPDTLDGAFSKVSKAGYYASSQKHAGSVNPADFKDGWAWNVQTTLRKKEKPIPMYAKIVELELPEQRQEIGFDFEKGDWVKPYGQGLVTDCTFIGTKFFEDRDNNTTKVVMAFPGEGSGLLLDPAAKEESLQCSDFKTTRIAPDEGYEATREFVAKESTEDGYEGTTHEANYVFRSRTVLDDTGKIKSCHYGKLTRAVDVQRGAGREDVNPHVRFTYYFNPTPNDRNLEFDPEQNLFKDLKAADEVWAP